MAVDLLAGVLVSAPAALLAWRMRAVTIGGACAGFACAVTIYLGAYLAGTAVLGVALLVTIGASRFGRSRSATLNIAEEDDDQRGAANILANCAVGAIGALLAAISPAWSGEAGALAMVTGIAAGASDTVASELGRAYGGRPRAFPSLRPVAPGTPGAVSVAGTVAGMLAAAAIASPAVALWLLPVDRIPLIVSACTAGALIESATATRFEARGLIGNHALNLLNTACAAGFALWWIGFPGSWD
jgi:uncharacterized protein (TIGR00297 family)